MEKKSPIRAISYPNTNSKSARVESYDYKNRIKSRFFIERLSFLQGPRIIEGEFVILNWIDNKNNSKFRF